MFTVCLPCAFMLRFVGADPQAGCRLLAGIRPVDKAGLAVYERILIKTSILRR